MKKNTMALKKVKSITKSKPNAKVKPSAKSHQALAKTLPDVAVTTTSSLLAGFNNNPKKYSQKKNTSSVTQTSKTEQTKEISSRLERVGMYGVETMVRLAEGETRGQLPAKIDVAVNLTSSTARGIHMSRLYGIIFKQIPNKILSPQLLSKILEEIVASQEGLASLATIKVSMTLTLKRKALISSNQGFRHYPIEWTASYDAVKKQFYFIHRFKLLYSSTCPCSTALSVDLQMKDQGDQGKLFTEFAATPHAQRSEADLSMIFKKPPTGNFMTKLINQAEQIIATPVQTAVKREDEQEFARLNATHLMFCEDAARILKMALEKDTSVSDYRIQVSHFESLHAHDAVAISVKGIPGGLAP